MSSPENHIHLRNVRKCGIEAEIFTEGKSFLSDSGLRQNRRPGRLLRYFRPEVRTVWHVGAPPGRVRMKSDAWHLVFPLHASTPFPELMHEHLIFCSMHHFLSLPPEIGPFICSAAAKRANQLMQEHYYSAFLHQFPDLHRRPGLEPGRIQMKSDAWHLVFPLRASTPFPELMHEHSFFCSMHHFLPLPSGIGPFICSAAAKRANQLMQEHYFSAFLHQFPDLHRRPGLKPGRIQMKRDARKAPPAPVHLFPILYFPKGKN